MPSLPSIMAIILETNVSKISLTDLQLCTHPPVLVPPIYIKVLAREWDCFEAFDNFDLLHDSLKNKQL